MSFCEAFALFGQLSQVLPKPSPSESSWLAFALFGQLSTLPQTPSRSASPPRSAQACSIRPQAAAKYSEEKGENSSVPKTRTFSVYKPAGGSSRSTVS